MEPSGWSGYIDSQQGVRDVLNIASRKGAKLLAAVAASGLVLSPAFAASSSSKRPPAIALSFDPISSFTPANADPKLAAALAGRGLSLQDFKFTPAPEGLHRAVCCDVWTIWTEERPAQWGGGLRDMTRLVWQIDQSESGEWDNPAIVAGDVAKVKDADSALGGRETAIVGVSYSLKKFTGRVAVGAERGTEHPLPALRKGDNVSLDVGGSYSLSRRIALTGGVRYQIERDKMSALQDERRDSQAVYIGTAFKF